MVNGGAIFCRIANKTVKMQIDTERVYLNEIDREWGTRKRVTVYKHLKPIFAVTETDLFNLNPAKEFSFSH